MTHHKIIIRPMHNGTFIPASATSDISHVVAETLEECKKEAIAEMEKYGEYLPGDTHEFEEVTE